MPNSELPVVRAAGDAGSAGKAYGQACADLIRGQLHAWDRWTAGRGRSLADLVDGLSRRAGFRQAAERWAPQLVEEIHGIAAGAGADDDEVFALNCLDEAWWWGGRPSGCSVLAHSRFTDSAARPLAAQNMDLDVWMDGGQVALVRAERPGLPDVAVLTRAGMVGLCGANGSGLAVLVNTLPQLPVDPDGVPVAFVARMVLDCGDVAEASDLLRRLPHATGQAYTLVDRSGAVAGLECGSGTVRDYPPAAAGMMVHSNHPVAEAPDSASDAGADSLPEGQGAATISASSADRLEILREACGTIQDEDSVVRLLADSVAGVHVLPGRWGRPGWATFGSVIVRPGPTTRVRLTAGPADSPAVELTLTGA